jgi:Mycothiol maleylpyruvate isomerase N-terminal domain
MTSSHQNIPINTVHLFPVLDKLLIELLKSLTIEEWHCPTIAKQWTVKDIASHLLDGNLRTLSILRDHYFGDPASNIHTYTELVAYLNQLNMSWTAATKRLSPQVLIELLEITGKQFHEQLESLAPFDTAVFSVAWAGQQQSENWFHIAREYTEKFIHQQQIREAVGKQALLIKKLFYPFIDTFMYGLPHTYRNVHADTGTAITIKILTDIGGEWHLIKTDTSWELIKSRPHRPSEAIVSIDPDTAWKIFSKGISPEQAYDKVEIYGDRQLAEVALQMVSVMA